MYPITEDIIKRYQYNNFVSGINAYVGRLPGEFMAVLVKNTY
jgi:hypothetical protein